MARSRFVDDHPGHPRSRFVDDPSGVEEKASRP